MTEIRELQKQLQKAMDECERLKDENERLKKRLERLTGDTPDNLEACSKPPELHGNVHSRSPAKEKIALFRSLFRGREDVYATRWVSKSGKSGYSPSCANEWDRPLCKKPEISCAQCDNREFLPITDQVIRDHLIGKHTIGVYPLLKNDTCWFLACDFDKSAWERDVSFVLKVCDEMGISAILERSRSGKGGHIWIFFEQAVSASLARKLGSTILTRAMERRHEIGLDSYDRFFPNQDTVPQGGFGNLIALPLQKEPRRQKNSLFLNRDFEPYVDQWAFLSTVERISTSKLETMVREAEQEGKILGVGIGLGDHAPWTLSPSGRRLDQKFEGPVPKSINVVQSNLIYVEKKGLPSALINRLIRIAAFQNPEFYRAQAMRFPTYNKPRIICCAENFPEHIGLPRGCMEEIGQLLQTIGSHMEIQDERNSGHGIDVTFHGELAPPQSQAADALLAYDIGILCAPTAFGKTVVGTWMISERKVNTLVLVHRQQLLEQWRERLAEFLDVNLRMIGEIGGGKNSPIGQVDVAMLQSLYRKGVVRDIVADYGHVVVDECHHISAFTFEQVMKASKAKFVTGLTATPVRKDGHHPIIVMQCGPIRFQVDPKEQADARPFDHRVIIRSTDFELPGEVVGINIHKVYDALIEDESRNAMIVRDVVKAVKAGRSPLVLTERSKHREELAKRLDCLVENVIVLRGGLSRKKRQEVFKMIKEISKDEERVLIATGRYIGEGFDDPRLDTLFLTMPISWKGRVRQYAGRLHRLTGEKQVVKVFDYVDRKVSMAVNMYKKRLRGYKEMGYDIEEGPLLQV